MVRNDGHEQVRAVRKRHNILAAAITLAFDRGTSAVTHRRVAEAADVSLSAIRYYYRTREELLVACIEEIERRRAEEADRIISSLEPGRIPDPGEAARLILRAYHGPDLDDAEVKGALGFIIDCARESPELSHRLSEMRQVINRQLDELLILLGVSRVGPGLATAVLDGSIVASTAEAKPHAADLAIADLAIAFGNA